MTFDRVGMTSLQMDCIASTPVLFLYFMYGVWSTREDIIKPSSDSSGLYSTLRECDHFR